MLLIGLKLTVVVDNREVRRVDLLFDPLTGKRTGEHLEGGAELPANAESLRNRGITVAVLDQGFSVPANVLRDILRSCDWRRKEVTKACS
jgi:hypothetical protein